MILDTHWNRRNFLRVASLAASSLILQKQRANAQIKEANQSAPPNASSAVPGNTSENLDPSKLLGDFNAMQARLAALDTLFSECKSANISTDYDLVNYSVIRLFIDYGKDDVKHGYLSRAAYVTQQLEKLYAEATNNLAAYLAKTKIPLPAYRYRTGQIGMDERSFIADVQGPTGEVKRRPLFLVGYVGFDQVFRNIALFRDSGNNEVEVEIGPNSVVFPPRHDGELYSLDFDALNHKVIPAMAQAEASNISVDVLLSPHYFPQWVLSKWPQLSNTNGGDFIKFCIDAPEARAIEETFLRAVIPVLSQCRSLHSFILSNEPQYLDSANDQYTRPLWIAYLKKTYGTAENMLNTHGTMYASFDDVPVPSGDKPEPTPLFYDWTVFNAERFANWHRWMADIIHSIAPRIPVGVKVLGDRTLQHVELMGAGIDPEQMSNLSDINGCDASAFVQNEQPYIGKFMFYDLLASMKKAPVFNYEDHFIEDRNTNFGSEQVAHVRTDLFMGAFHGRSGSSAWVWDRSYDAKSDYANSMLTRPDVLAVAGKTCLDLNRLAFEVTAFQEAPASIAILYSVASHVYAPYVKGRRSKDQATFTVYEGVIYNGLKAAFISEKQVASGELRQYKLLIVPDQRNVPGNVLAAIRQYLADDGKVLLLGDMSLSKDDYDRPWGTDYQNVLNASIVISNIPTPLEFQQQLGVQLKALGLFSNRLIDTTTREPATGIEYRFVQYKGHTLMVAANYLKQKREVTIELEGKSVKWDHDLLTEGNEGASTLALEPFNPVFVEIDLWQSKR